MDSTNSLELENLEIELMMNITEAMIIQNTIIFKITHCDSFSDEALKMRIFIQ